MQRDDEPIATTMSPAPEDGASLKTLQSAVVSPPSHIFVVGMHRSDTALMRHVLNDHSAVAMCDETHYMRHVVRSAGMRQYFSRFQLVSEDLNVERLVDHMHSAELTC